MFVCNLCDEENFGSLEDLYDHVSSGHMGWLRYECPYCPTFRSTKSQIVGHTGLRHPDEASKVLEDTDALKTRKLNELVEECITGEGSSNNFTSRDPSSEVKIDDEKSENSTKKRKSSRVQENISYTKFFSDSSIEQNDRQEFKEELKKEHDSAGAKKSTTTDAPEMLDVIASLKNSLAGIQTTHEDSIGTTHEDSIGAATTQKTPESHLRPASRRSARGHESFTDASNRKFRSLFCPPCNRQLHFSTKSQLLEHILRRHLRKKLIFCTYCDYSNRGVASYMKGHFMKHHPDKEVKYRDDRSTCGQELKIWAKDMFQVDIFDEDLVFLKKIKK